MGMKRYLCLLFACIAIFGCIPAQAAAADIGEQAAEIAEQEPQANLILRFLQRP